MIGLYTVKPTTTVVQEPHRLNYAFSPSIQRLHFGVVGATCATSCVCFPSSRTPNEISVKVVARDPIHAYDPSQLHRSCR